MSSLRFVLITAAFMLAAGVAHATIYRWTGPGGTVHFGQTPPSGVNAQPFSPGTPPPPGNGEAQKQLQNYVKQQESAQAKADKREQDRKAQASRAKARQRNCHNARRQHQLLETSDPHRLLYKDAQGKERRMTPRVRKERLKTLSKLIRQYCGKQQNSQSQ